jgi:hypothetical protein
MSKTKEKQHKTNASVGYAGNVEIKLDRGKKTIKTIKTHNEGKLSLFSFLANALIGSFDAGGAPRYVILGNGATDAVAQQVSTNAIPYSNVSIETNTAENDTHASAVFKFLIPFSSVSAGQQINVVRLYSQNSTSWGNHIAYFLLPTQDEEGNPIDPLISDGKSNILITWTMKITNKTINPL